MRKKSGFTIVEQAAVLVPEFASVVRKLEQQVVLRGQSKYKKDRIVPLAESMAVGLGKYLMAENLYIWSFNGKEPDGR